MDMRDVRTRADTLSRFGLEDGRWYALTLGDGKRLVLQAHDLTTEWMLIGDPLHCSADDEPAGLIVRPDGTFERDDNVEPEPQFGDVRAIAEGLTVADLVPADMLASPIWAAHLGHEVICLGSGASGDTSHNPRCHAADGIPLWPNSSSREWRM